MGGGSPTSRDLWVSLSFKHDPAGMLVARLVVDEHAGRLVECELTSDEFTRLLAGETLVVSGEVGGLERLVDEEPAVERHVVEPEVMPEDAGHEPVGVEEPPTAYSAFLYEPPARTEPIARGSDVAPGEVVVAYVGGRWRDAVVVSSNIGSLLVGYSRPVPFGQVQLRVTTDRVRRRLS
jgi:hypothetical protein